MNTLTLTGIADEAANDIDGQIEVHRELGWKTIELRMVDGENAAGALSDDAFARTADQLEAAGMTVTSFASAIGNWSRRIDNDFVIDTDELKTAIPRMRRLGTKFIRTMSWIGEGVDESAWRDEAIRRYRELAKMAEDGGILLAHENCNGWAGLGPTHTRTLIEEIGSPNLVVLFDIGNTVSHGLPTWEYYEGVKDLIRYVHVKDGRRKPDGAHSSDFTYPGEGDAMVREVLTDLLKDGYQGVVAIEPHLASLVHVQDQDPDPEAMRTSYLKYGRLLEAMVAEIRSGVD
jgi:sugar phosphate isomerase/epimerase